ncbi:MAG: exodeoxyribonuclease VII small subunit [Anaerolineales bacterium]|nr:exodeoxyribonuclease VII small subunit [Anaerolineales bacterium]
MSETLDNMTFEAALEELEVTVTQLEMGDLTLDESLALFERGQKLAEYCNVQLEQASLRVEQLTADGEIVQMEIGD